MNITQQELDALPEESMEISWHVIETPRGKVRIPVAPTLGAMFDPIMVTDIYGGQWAIHETDGVRRKRRMWTPEGQWGERRPCPTV